ncbi:peptidoglycan hydrolase-like protein with peptidoglycan-binding domain [Agrobacterium vitis]|nr:peptidoglycan hydrolase-like protein with peptidoglycan-binding domain [Agrobacterium vitis]MBE1439224.1 peptidoglycan hydrolase-like protein with peptidoglycan-binding domain [Agrobacterium vitis]
MATRKRKLPDRKRSVRKEPGFVILAARACLRLAARNPGAVLGTVGFLVVFGCVAANAFWYQPGRHPSPFLRTRDPHDFSAMLGLNTSTALNPHPNDVTTFLIQRQDKSAKTPVTGPVVAPTTAPVQQAAPAALADVQTVVAIQTQLARLGLYDGPLNGERDARTNAAISAYQQRMGVPTTGQPSDDLLTLLAADKGEAAEPAIATVHPLERPSLVKVSDDDAIDPVAAAIRSAEKKMVTAPATKASVQVAAPVPKVGVGAAQTVASVQTASAQTASTSIGPGLVMDIQRGLINVAYTGITVDGVVGDKTKAAIRHFQRHYRLPETGEPDMAVLKTLKSIGAL